MYNLFFWAVAKGALDGKLLPIEGKTDVPFRWVQIPTDQQRKLEAIAFYRAVYDDDPDKEKINAESFLVQPASEISEQLRIIMEQLANRGLQLMELEVETENPDAYRTVTNLVETINQAGVQG